MRGKCPLFAENGRSRLSVRVAVLFWYVTWLTSIVFNQGMPMSTRANRYLETYQTDQYEQSRVWTGANRTLQSIADSDIATVRA